MNSTYSSLVDYGLTNSQFADLSSVSEDEVEEAKGTQYQNLGKVSKHAGGGGQQRTPATARAHHSKGQKRGEVLGRIVMPQDDQKRAAASPFELAPSPFIK